MSHKNSVLKVGIVGCGWISRNVHIPTWRRMPNIRISAVTDLNQEARKKIASELDVKEYADMDAMLCDEGIDIIDICTPTSSHFQLAMEALKAGKHVLVEKPMALKSHRAKMMVDEAKKRDLRIGVVHHYLYSRGFLKVKEEMAQDLWHVKINFWGGKHVEEDHWALKEDVGGGLLFEQGVHPCYILVGLLGLPDTLTATGFYRLDNSHLNTCDLFVSFKKGLTTGSLHISPTEFDSHTCIFIGKFGEVHWDLTNDGITKLRDPRGPRGGFMYAGLKFSYNRLSLGVSALTSGLAKGLRFAIRGVKEYDQYRLFRAFIDNIQKPDATFYSTGEVGYQVVKLLEDIKSSLRETERGLPEEGDRVS